MSKRTVLTAAAAAAVVVVWAGSTAYLGRQVQQTLEAQLAPWQSGPEAGQRLLRVTDVQYERGLLGATRTVSMTMGCGAQSASFSWRDDIRHGPLPGFAGLGAARIDSRLLLSDAQKQQWLALTGSAQPELSLRTWISLNGNSSSALDLPALQIKNADGGLLKLEKAQGQIRVNADGSAHYSLSVPGYEALQPLQQGQGQLRMVARDLHIESDGLAPAWWALSGKGQGRLGLLEVGTQGASGPAQTMVALQDLRYTQQGAISNGLYGASMELQGKGRVGNLALDTVSMKLRMERLHGDTYARFVRDLYAGTCPAEGADPKAEAAQMLAGLTALLPHNPSFSLDELQVTLGAHSAKIAYSGGLHGATADDLKAPNLAPVLLKKAVLQAEVDVALPLIDALANAMGKPLPPDALEHGVSQAVAQGLLLRDGERVRAKFELREGAAQLNGKPIPLPGMPAQPAQPAQ